MKLYVKHMVSNCCKLMVKKEFDKLGIQTVSIELGELEVQQIVSINQFDKIRAALRKNGHELMEDKTALHIEQVKAAVLEMIDHTEEPPEEGFSNYVSNRLEREYAYLADLFSEVTGSTLQQFIIVNKVERAKLLMMEGQLTVKEIAYKLHYSSAAHFSNQFKKVTGLSPLQFKSLRMHSHPPPPHVTDHPENQEQGG